MRRLALLTAVLALGLAGVADAQRISPRIVGGTSVVQAGDYPWQVALSRFGTQYCGGSLIASQYVLSAAHCDIQIGDTVRIGSLQRSTGGETRTVAAVRAHPRTLVTEEEIRYDVTVLRLSTPVSPAHDKPIALATPSESALWAANTPLTITGWGDTNWGGNPSSTLQKAEVPRRTDSYCTSAYGTGFTSADQFCAGGGTIDTCQGDSGGPIAAPAVASPLPSDAGDWRLVGVTSWGWECATPGWPGVYARIAASDLYDWIDTVPPVAGTATLSGAAVVGQTLTCDPGTWTGGRAYREFQFLRDGVVATTRRAATYTVLAGDAGHELTCVAVGDNGAARVASAPSNAIAIGTLPVAPILPVPPIEPPVEPPVETPVTPVVEAVTDPAPAAAEPAPVATPRGAVAAPAATPAVTTTTVGKVRRSCKQRRCTLTITSTASALTVKIGGRTYRAKRKGATTFVVTTRRLKKGRHLVSITGATKVKKLTIRV